MTFDGVLMVDWSGGNDRGPTPKKDAIWACHATATDQQPPIYLRNRQIAADWITETLAREHAAGNRTLVGFDLCFAYPLGFARHLTGSDDPLQLWDWFAARVIDSPAANNRFDLAGQINGRFPGIGPFWFNGLRRDIDHLPRKGSARHGHGLPEKRAADAAAKGAFSPWQLAGAGAVGGQAIMGFPTLARLRQHFGAALSVWPFQTPDTPIVLAETYFSLLPLRPAPDTIKDAAQVSQYASLFARLPPAAMDNLLDHKATPEGWVLGLGHASMLRDVHG